MMGRREEPAWARGTVGLLAARERGDIDRKVQKHLTVTRGMIDRLGLETELHGHAGCVNCLEWSDDGTVLASASDDLHVILWDPFRYKQLHNISTGHTGNIFSVKFLTPDIIATCAADSTVRARSVLGGESLLECSCHCGRVKRLATAPLNPHLIWSAGEDGLILQHDLRETHRCNSDTANVLVNLLNHLGRYAEAKCVAVNPRRPYQLAVGANDFYVRLYDTRMIKLGRLQVSPSANTPSARVSYERQNMRCSRAGHGDPDNNIPRSAVQYFAPGHLSMEPNEHTFPKKATTYVAFSHDGNELLVNLGSEQVYLFDINSTRRATLVESFIIQHNHSYREGDEKSEKSPTKNGTNGTNGTMGAVEQTPMLTEKGNRFKEMANDLVNKGNYATAVDLYNNAIAECPDCAILYSNRAAALMKRCWAGDTYAAIKDCYRAIKLDPSHVKSHFRLAKALMELQRPREANECLRYFKTKFPRLTSHAVFLLQKDITVALDGLETQPDEVGNSPADSDDGQPTSVLERQLRVAATDYSHRFLGHCNTTTDIKEANFLGPEANFVAAGLCLESILKQQPTSVLERQLRVAATDYSHRFLGHCNTTTNIKEANFLGPEANFVAAGSDDGSMFIWERSSGNIVRCLRGDESIVNCIQMHPSMFLLATSGIEAIVRLWSPRPEDGTEESRIVPDSNAAAHANQQRMRSDPFEAMLLNISFAGGSERDLHSPACRTT